jgi:hypothetical protein
MINANYNKNLQNFKEGKIGGVRQSSIVTCVENYWNWTTSH